MSSSYPPPPGTGGGFRRDRGRGRGRGQQQPCSPLGSGAPPARGEVGGVPPSLLASSLRSPPHLRHLEEDCSSPRDEGEVVEGNNMNPRKRRGHRYEEDAAREMERRQRMARLRAELDEEEQTMMQPLDQATQHEQAAAATKKDQDKDEDQEGKDAEEDDGDDEEALQMKQMMGFAGFGSTHNTKVEDNHTSAAKGAAAKHKARKYRQYMNRKNGFNRPLDPMD